MTERPDRVTVHMVGNAHIDPVWLWPLSEGRAEVQSTYHTAIALIREFDAYVFTSGGAVTYRWVQEDDPELYAAIQQAVAEGRWVLVNGWWLQPDCNIPSGESFARHGLYGQRFLQEHFGRRARVGYNVDSFGHAGTLPQLLKLAGLEHYVFFRPGPHEKDLPNRPFWWEAPGGARVLACRPPLHYGSPDNADVLERMRAAADEAPEGLPMVMCFYGVGNHGGGPTRRNVQALVDTLDADVGAIPVFSSPDAYFDRVRQLSSDWPVLHDELQHHARGCYTALSRVKQENRYAEHGLMQAERLASWATLLCDTPSAQPQLQKAWEEVLFNQFHDIMAGTSIRESYDEAWEDYERARALAISVQNQALTALAAKVEVLDRDHPVLVWNTLPWERTDTVRLALPMGGWRHDFRGERYPGTPRIEDTDGNLVPCQLLDVELDLNTYIAHVEALVTVPALGACPLYVSIPETDPPAEEPPTVFADTIENEYYRLRVDPETGALASIRDLQRHEELLSGPACLPLVIHDDSDTWSHDIVNFRDVLGSFQSVSPAELLHNGPTGAALRVRSTWGSSSIVQEYALRTGSAAIEVTMTVDWHEQFKMLKLAFPLAISGGVVASSAPYGWVSRQANGEEEPCQGWVDLTGQATSGRRGLCLLNDSKYGYDALDGELRLSVLRSPIYAFHDPRRVVPGVSYHFVDQGEQVVRYVLIPHTGDWRAVSPGRRSYELQEPLIAAPATPHEGPWHTLSLLRAAPESIVLSTVKLAEDGDRLLVRGYEASGEPTRITLTSPALDRCWTHDVRAHEVFTLALPIDGGVPVPLDLLEESLS